MAMAILNFTVLVILCRTSFRSRRTWEATMLGISVMAMAVAMDTGRFTIWLYWVLNTPCMEVMASAFSVVVFIKRLNTISSMV